MPPPVIVLHGLTASVMRDEYPVEPEEVFNRSPFGDQAWDRLILHPDDTAYEAQEPARVRPSHILPIGYRELIEALRDGLSPSKDKPVPVFGFAYDWREDIFVTARRLGDFIREVIGRTRLLAHYPRTLAEVDLVGHSTGGMVIAACLSRGHHVENGVPLVRRVATLATAYHGAVDALEKVTAGESELFGNGRDAERHMARLMPAIYQHIPSYKDAFIDRINGNVAVDVFDPVNWQSSVFGELAEHLRLFSRDPQFTDPAKRTQQAFRTLTAWLKQGEALLKALNTVDPKAALLDNAGAGRHPGWLVIVGQDERTRWQGFLTMKNGERIFGFEKEQDGFDPAGHDDPATVETLVRFRSRLGDGTVPILSAVPDWADRERVVTLARRDFGTLENWPLRGFPTFHSVLPWLNQAHRWIISFLLDKQAGKREIVGRPLYDVTRPAWQSPVTGAVIKA